MQCKTQCNVDKGIVLTDEVHVYRRIIVSASDVISCLKIYTEEKNGLDPISKGPVLLSV